MADSISIIAQDPNLLDTAWKSKKTPINIDSTGYFVKFTIPEQISTQKLVWKSFIHNKTEIKRFPASENDKNIELTNFSGSQWSYELSNIKLSIKTIPTGAQVWIIPLWTWKTTFESKDIDWKKNLSLIPIKYRFNNSDLEIITDRTSYMIIFKKDDQVLQRVHFTKAESIEPIQEIEVTFN